MLDKIITLKKLYDHDRCNIDGEIGAVTELCECVLDCGRANGLDETLRSVLAISFWNPKIIKILHCF